MTDQLKLLSKRRRTLRQMGLTTCTLQFVEKYFQLKRTNPRVSLADVSRVLGYSRSLATRYMKRAEELQLVVRVGNTFILFAKTLLVLAASKLNQIRKRLYLKAKSKSVHTRSTHRETNIFSNENWGYQTRQEALADLKASYIPVHLRRHKA